MLQARNTMLHIILTAVCLLQIQGTYSRYACNRCIPRCYPPYSPDFRNVFQDNCFCYNRPRETIVTFNHKPQYCLPPCECKKLNTSLPVVADNPTTTPVLPPASNEEKTSPQSPPFGEKENPSPNPIPTMPTATVESITQPSPTSTPPGAIDAPTSAPILQMDDVTIPSTSTSINPMCTEGSTSMGEFSMLGGTSNQIQTPMFYYESTCPPCHMPMDFLNMEVGSQSPCPEFMFPSNLDGEVPPSSSMQMEPLSMEDGTSSEPNPTSTNPMPIGMEGDMPQTNLCLKKSTTNPISKDGNAQLPIPSPMYPSMEGVDSTPMETTSDQNPTEEEGNPSSPSATTDIGNMEEGMFNPKLPEPQRIEKGSAGPDPVQMEEEISSNSMLNAPKEEPSQPTPSPTNPMDMADGNPPVESSQPRPISPPKPQEGENMPPSSQPMETVSMEEAPSSPMLSAPIGMDAMPMSMGCICMDGQMPSNPTFNDPMSMEAGPSQPNVSPTDSMVSENLSPISMPTVTMEMGEGSSQPCSMPSNPTFNHPMPMEGGISQPTSFSTNPIRMVSGDPSPIPNPMVTMGTSGGCQSGSISFPVTNCGSSPSNVPTYINEPCYRQSQTPVIDVCNIPSSHSSTIVGYQSNMLSHQPQETFHTPINVAGHASFCTRTPISHIKPVYEEVIRHIPVLKNVIKNRVVETTHHIPIVEKLIVQEQSKVIRHIPVVQKVRRNVVECRTRHVPVLQHRARTVVEPYTEHVIHTEKITRPVIESLIKQVPMVFSQCKPVLHQRIRHVPIVETRCRPVIEETITTVPVRRRIFKNVVEQKLRPIIGPCTSCTLQAPSEGMIFVPNSFHSCCKNVR